jgi:DNA-binding NtrC family response regulator
MGGYPNFIPLYEQLGYRVDVVNSQRKARNLLKQDLPDVIVAEYNFQSQFRDRTSNLETLVAVLQKHPRVKLVVFYEPGHAHKFAVLSERYPVFAALPFPVDRDALEDALTKALPESAG